MKKILKNFIKKYPFTFACIVLLSIVLIIMIDKIGFIGILSGNFVNNFLIASVCFLITLIDTSFLASNVKETKRDAVEADAENVVANIENVVANAENVVVNAKNVGANAENVGANACGARTNKILNNNYIKNLIGIGIGIIIYFISSILYSIYTGTSFNGQYITYPVSAILISLTCFFIISEKEIDFAHYVQKIFTNMLKVLLLYIIVVIGTSILFFICWALFRFFNFQKYLDIIIVESVLIFYIGTFISFENIDENNSLASKVLIKYVMFIMVLIGFILFYIYFIKIIILRTLPSNQLFTVCTILFSIGLSTGLMSKSFDEGTLYDKIIKYLPIAFIPALVLQIISIWFRINQYGITAPRYICIMIIIYEIAYIIIYILKYKKIKYIYIISATLMFILWYVPKINILEFYKKDREKITNSVNENYKNRKKYKFVNCFDQYSYINVDIAGYEFMSEVILKFNNTQYGARVKNENEISLKDYKKVEIEYGEEHKFKGDKLIENKNNKEKIKYYDLSSFFAKIEKNIIESGYSVQDKRVLKDVGSFIINGDTKLIIKSIYFEYDEQFKIFTNVSIRGLLLS